MTIFLDKSRFMDNFKIVLELFRKCLDILLTVKWHTFACIFSPRLIPKLRTHL